MKNTVLFTLFLLMGVSVSLQAQWAKDISGNKTSKKLSNMALDAYFNLEYGRAQGLAMAALEVDKKATLAMIVLANSTNGSVKEGYTKKLESMKMTSSEKGLITLFDTPIDQRPSTAASMKSSEPMITYIAAYESYTALEEWSKLHKELSGPAMNSLGYTDFLGRGPAGLVAPEGKNYDLADERFKTYMELHNGPNAFDSYAEFKSNQGDYENAFKYQMEAYNRLSLVSPYTNSLMNYYRHNNLEEMSAALKKRLHGFYDAASIGQGVREDFYADLKISDGMSNLSSWIIEDKSDYLQRQASQSGGIQWHSMEVYDVDMAFGPNADFAIVTFYMKGSYTGAGGVKVTDYHTRAANVWVLSDGEWKMMHSNFAPFSGGKGVPKS